MTISPRDVVAGVFRAVLGPTQYEELRVAAATVPRRKGVMVDVGAHHGTSLARFVARGWVVHAFEPDPANRAVLESRYGSNRRVIIDPRAVSDASNQRVELFTSDISTGISGLVPFHPSHVATAVVTTVTLADYLFDRGVNHIDLLKTDLEGHDLKALDGLDWSRWHPTAVVCEFEDRKTKPQGYTHDVLANFLVNRGYSVLVSEWEPVVAYGTLHTWRRLVRWPADVPDDAWGNLIAVPGDLDLRTLRVGRLIAAQLRLRQRVDYLRRNR